MATMRVGGERVVGLRRLRGLRLRRFCWCGLQRLGGDAGGLGAVVASGLGGLASHVSAGHGRLRRDAIVYNAQWYDPRLAPQKRARTWGTH